MSSCISYDPRYGQCFPKEKVFVIQILDYVFEVEAELYTCYMNSMTQRVSPVCRMKELVQDTENKFLDYEK
jgi:hypothetical protein